MIRFRLRQTSRRIKINPDISWRCKTPPLPSLSRQARQEDVTFRIRHAGFRCCVKNITLTNSGQGCQTGALGRCICEDKPGRTYRPSPAGERHRSAPAAARRQGEEYVKYFSGPDIWVQRSSGVNVTTSSMRLVSANSITRRSIPRALPEAWGMSGRAARNFCGMG